MKFKKYSFVLAAILFAGCSNQSTEPQVQLEETEHFAQGGDVETLNQETKTLVKELNNDAAHINSDSIRFYISKGADANAINSLGYSVLQYAVEENDSSLVALLLEKGAEIQPNEYSGESVLMLAYKHGTPQLLKYLIEKGADPESHNFDGETILMFMAQYGDVEIATILIDKGANVNAVDGFGKPVIAYAEKDEMIKLLKARGAR